MDGIYLNKTKTARHRILSYVIAIGGSVIALFFGFFFVATVFISKHFSLSTIAMLALFLLISGIGLFMLVFAIHTFKLLKSIVIYNMMLTPDKPIELSQLAMMRKMEENKVRKQLEELIEREYILGYFSDDDAKITLSAEGI